MRILNLDGHYFVTPFKKMGHDVLSIGPLGASDIVLSKAISLSQLLEILNSRNFKPDLIVWGDICKPPSVIGFETLPAVTIGYSIDQYCNPWHGPYRAAFDLMLVAQKDYLDMFEDPQLSGELEWSPLFCRSDKDKDLQLERNLPVGFVGTIDKTINTERKLFFDILQKALPITVIQGDYVPIYNRSQIVLNQSAVGELNFRIFEAMACGAAVLTEETDNGLNEIFSNGENILLYPRGNAMAASIIAKAALRRPEELQELAANGRRIVVSNHSSTIRAKYILKRAEEISSKGPTWRQSNQDIVLKYLSNTFNMLAVDDVLPLNSELRTFYLSIAEQMKKAVN